MSSYRILLLIIIIFELFLFPQSIADSIGLGNFAFLKGDYVIDSIPEKIVSGESGQYSITFMNNGMVAWEYGVEKFGVTCTGISSGISVTPEFAAVPQGSSIAPGKSFQFIFSIYGINPGTYGLVFTPVKIIRGQPSPIGESVSRTLEVTPKGTTTISQNSGSIRIHSGKIPLLVRIDGQEIGSTPVQSAGISPGIHHVMVTGNGYEKELTIVVKPGEISSLYLDPNRDNFCLTSALLPSSTTPNPLLTFIISNFILFLGIFLSFTILGVYASLRMRAKLRRVSHVVQEHSFFSTLSDIEKNQTFRIEVKRKGSKNSNVKYDPLMLVCNEGDSADIIVRVTNNSSNGINVKGKEILAGETQEIVVRVGASTIGDHIVEHDLVHCDRSGSESATTIIFRYRVRPLTPSLDWAFSRFVFGPKGVIAIVKVRNYSPNPIFIDDLEIPSKEEREIEIDLSEPDEDSPEIFTNVHILYNEGSRLTLPVSIPWNRGIILHRLKKINESLEFYHKLLSRDRGSADIWMQYGKILEDIGNQKAARDAFEQSLIINPANGNVKDLLKHTGSIKGTEVISPPYNGFTTFPSGLLGTYRPLIDLGKDLTGLLFIVERIDDGKKQMVKIIDTSKVTVSSLHLPIQTWRSLHHPNIARLSRWELDPIPYLEIDHPSGAIQHGEVKHTLSSLSLPIPKRAAVKIGLGISQGIAYLHRQGTRHYLLDPSIIFLDKNLHVRIGGFDCVVGLSGSDCNPYCWILAPEQTYPERYGNPGKKTDIFQIGAITYFLLTGQHVYGHKGLQIISHKDFWNINDHLLILPSIYRSDLGIFDDFISKCLAIDKNERYNSVDELISELETLLVEIPAYRGSKTHGK